MLDPLALVTQVSIQDLKVFFDDPTASFVNVVRSAVERGRQSSMFTLASHPVAVLMKRLREQVRALSSASLVCHVTGTGSLEH